MIQLTQKEFKDNYYIKSKRTPYFLIINILAHISIITAIFYAEWWMWALGFLWGYWINMTCYAAGYHRYYTHRAFKAPRWYDYYFQFMALFGNPGPAIIWRGIHTLHHKYSDTRFDPHSPKDRGFWNVWTMGMRAGLTFWPPTRDDLVDWIRANRKDHIAKWIHSNYLLLIFSIMAVLLLIDPLLFVMGFCVPVFCTHHASAIVNAYCHRTGKALNEELAGFVTVGEGYHLNHHEDPSNYTTLPESHKWWQFDITGLFIKMIRI